MTNKILNYIYVKTMLSYCFKCRKNTESKNPKVVKTKNGRIKSAVCDCKKFEFIKKQEAKQLLSKLTGVKVPVLSDLTIANILF